MTTATPGTSHLEALNLEVGGCVACRLHEGRTQVVPGEGNPTSAVMFIGEGPGMNEDRLGRPFVGRAGQFLDFLITSIDLQRGDVYITNVVKCRPPDNRDPMPDELAACRPFLDRQIALINPRVIVTLGRHSLGAFFPGEVISRVHGIVRKKGDRVFFPMYHPAAALHQQRYRETIVADMQKLGVWLAQEHDPPKPPTAEHRRAAEDVEPQQLSLFNLPVESWHGRMK
jgi:uracil-DNA glycosylase family 4